MMTHHNSAPYSSQPVTFFYRLRGSKTRTSSRIPYGVPCPSTVLPRGILFKRWRETLAFSRTALFLPEGEVGVVLELIRLWAIKGRVYATAKQIAEAAHVSKNTVWRTINHLEDLKMVQVVNRYVQREWAQISNLFLLERLIIALARFLAEHGERNLGPMMARFLALPGREFWSRIWKVDNFWELVGNKRPVRGV